MLAVVAHPSRFSLAFLTVRLQNAGWTVRAFATTEEATAYLASGSPVRLLVTSDPSLSRDQVTALTPQTRVLLAELDSAPGFDLVVSRRRPERLDGLLDTLCMSCLDEDPLRGDLLAVLEPAAGGALAGALLPPAVTVTGAATAAEVEAACETRRFDLVVADPALVAPPLRAWLEATRLPLLWSRGPGAPASDLVDRVLTHLKARQLHQELEERQRLLQDVAMKDPLTGLANRRTLFEMAPKVLAKALRSSEPNTLVLIDLHPDCGTEALRLVGGLLSTLVRKEDLASRFGETDFVILFSNCGLDSARLRAEGLRQTIRGLRAGGTELLASFGVAPALPGQDFESLFQDAEQAVTRARDRGGDRVEVWFKA